MRYFQTGLEPLLEKIALNIGPSTAVHPEAMHPQYAARAARRTMPQQTANRGPIQLGGRLGLSPAEEAHATRLQGMTPEQRRKDFGLPTTPAEQRQHAIQHEMTRAETNVPAATGPVPPGILQRFGRGAKTIGKGLALGTGAALLGTGWALNKQHEEDARNRGVAYAPMQGLI